MLFSDAPSLVAASRAAFSRVKGAAAQVVVLGLLALTLLVGLPAGPAAAATGMRFGHLSAEDGLSSNWVRSIYKDSRGFMWFGTDAGLNRYDGDRFVTFHSRADDPSSLAGEKITTIVEDRRKRLWVACAVDGGIALFDRATNRFRRFLAGQTPGSLSGNDVPAMVVDRQGRLWVGTNNGLDRLDPDTFVVEHFPVETGAAPGALANHVAALAEDREGHFWVGTYAGLLRFDRGSGRYTRLPVGTDGAPGPGRAAAVALHEDAGGMLWVGSMGAGLYRIDPSSDRYTRYLPNPRSSNSLSSTAVFAITSDRDGHVLLGTENGGLDILDPRTGSFTRYLPDLEDEASIGSASIYSLMIDDQGVLWIGTFDGGVSLVSPAGQRFKTIRARRGGLNYRHVGALAEDPTGDLWIGTDGGGLNRMDRRTGRFTYHRHDPLDQGSVGSDAIIDLYMDPQQALWVGTWGGGLNRLDPGATRFVRYKNDPRNPRSIRDDRVWKVLEMPGGGELMVGTHVGVDVFDRGSGSFSRLAARHQALAEGQPVYALETDRAGRLWIGSREPAALQVVDRGSGRVLQHRHDPQNPQTICSGTVQALCRDSRGNMWVGTENGLSVMPAGASEFRRFSTTDGLPHDSVTNILEDGEGNLWLSTGGGVSKLEGGVGLPEKPLFLNFDVNDGLQGREFRQGAALRSRAGEIFFGGQRGVSYFFPPQGIRNPVKPPVVLTDLKIFNQSAVIGGEGSPLASSITETTDLTLSYADAVVTFEFAALSFVLPQKNRFAHMLEGVDRSWSQPSSQRSVTYAHLPPGAYVFRVRASNNDAVWNEDGLALRLRVTPPFWRAWWFQALVGLSLGASLALAYRLRVHRIHAHARDLADKVQERTRELRQLNEELEGRVAARTAELEAEKERLAVTLRSIGDGVVATDVAGCVLLLNRAAEQLTGWTLHEAQWRPLREVLPLLDRNTHQPLPDPVKAVLATGSVSDLPNESLLVRRDGREVLIADSAAPIRDRESQVVGVVLVLRDVTERRKVEEQLQTAEKLEALGILAGGIAHDFNNLLTGVFGYVDLAHRRSNRPEAVREVLSKALSVVRKARGLTGQLLTFSRLGEPVTVPLALAELLAGCARFALSGSNVSCAMEIPEGLWACQGDEQQIDQVIDNLLLNARQSMPEGGTIRLAAVNLVVPEQGTGPIRPGRYVRITIRDQGVGMSPQVRARIFEPFFTTKSHGTGLGLATAYSIVRKHGGHIEVESEPGAGATFFVYLPASREPARDEGASTRDVISGQGRVLVLDDEEYVRDVAQQALEDLGYAATTVSTSEEAVQVFREAHGSSQPFDAVILDLTIPGGIGGLGVLSRLRVIDPAVRAIASSGYSSDTVVAEPRAHGFVDRLIKPYTAVELSEVLSRTLRNRDSS